MSTAELPRGRGPGRGLDVEDRALTAAESRALYGDATIPGCVAELGWWARYIGAGTVRTYAEAVSTGLALETRQQITQVDERMGFAPVPLVVNPTRAREYMVERLARADEVVPPGWRLAHALNFMGLAHDSVRADVASFMPAGEHERANPYRHRGWWLLSGEVAWRIEVRKFVPCLSPMRGRRPRVEDAVGATAVSGEVMTLPSRRPRRSDTDTERLVTLLRNYCQTNPPTAVLRLALDQGRPFCRRTRGNPALQPDGVMVETTAALVAPAALAEHARRVAHKVELPPDGWSPQLAERVLYRIESVYPAVKRVREFAAMDDPGRAARGLWFRVEWAWTDADPISVAELGAEFRAYQAQVAHEHQALLQTLAAEQDALADHYFDLNTPGGEQ